MAKKTFKGGLDSLLDSPSDKNKVGRPVTTRTATKASEEGMKYGEVRATFILTDALLEMFKAIAWYERLKIKDASIQAFEEYITRHTEKYGPEKTAEVLEKYRDTRNK